jgi:hypothetical protein
MEHMFSFPHRTTELDEFMQNLGVITRTHARVPTMWECPASRVEELRSFLHTKGLAYTEEKMDWWAHCHAHKNPAFCSWSGCYFPPATRERYCMTHWNAEGT